MGRVFGIIGIVIVVAVVAVLALAATRPDSFQVTRSAHVAAPPERVYPLLADFHRWQAWSPWEKLDPNMQRTFSGAAAGKGAVYAWNGSGKAGAGRMEITRAEAPSHLTIDLHFLKPFDSSSTTDFQIQPEGGGSRVTWAMHGPAPFISKLMGLFFSMDKMIGKDFEAGLANLNRAAQADEPPAA